MFYKPHNTMHILDITLTPAAQAIAGWIEVGILVLLCIALIMALIVLIKVVFMINTKTQ